MEPPDEELVRRYQAGDEDAFEALVRRWNEPLQRLALRLCGDAEAAADIRQMAFVHTYRALQDFELRSSFATWLFRIVTNLVRDRHRSQTAYDRLKRVARSLLPLNGHPHQAPPESSLSRQEVSEHVAHAVRSLPAREREVIVLRHYHDLSFPEISRVVDAPVTTVKSRMTKGLERLRNRLPGLVED